MAEVAVCYSIIERMLNANIWITNDENTQMALRVNNHTMLLSEELAKKYKEYFETEKKEYIRLYEDFIAAKVASKKNAIRMLGVSEIQKVYSQKSPYINELLNVALTGKEKMVLSDLPEIRQQEIGRQELVKIESSDILNSDYSNVFAKYTLPIKKYNVGIGEDSNQLAEWIGYFFSGEKEIVLYDNYACTKENIESLKCYLLPYIDKGATLSIYTTIEKDSLSIDSIKNEFSKPEYQDWKISVFWVGSKHDNHTRVILTDNYRIDLDRGISVFGTKGKTNQCVMDIDYRDATSNFEFNVVSRQIV